MKMYTNSEQTVKLVELGLPKPNGLEFLVREKDNPDNAQIIQRMAYSIGELIEMLPEVIYIDDTTFSRVINKTEVFYYSWDLKTYALLICDVQAELIDNLYDMIVQLKEEGVI